MLFNHKHHIAMYAAMGVCFLLLAVTSHAVEIRIQQEAHELSQEQMGRDIARSSWLRSNQGQIQEELGQLIQEEGAEGQVSQETLGSGIAAAAHLSWEQGLSQEQMGQSIVRVAQIVVREAVLLAGRIQENLGQVILEDAQADFLTTQEMLDKQLIQQTQIKVATGVMTSALRSILEGRDTAPIPQEVFDVLRENRGYRELANFTLAVSMLESETGMTLSHLQPNTLTATSGTVSPTRINRGWGGFGEFGFFAISGAIFMMYVAGSSIKNTGTPLSSEDEVPMEFQKAA